MNLSNDQNKIDSSNTKIKNKTNTSQKNIIEIGFKDINNLYFLFIGIKKYKFIKSRDRHFIFIVLNENEILSDQNYLEDKNGIRTDIKFSRKNMHKKTKIIDFYINMHEIYDYSKFTLCSPIYIGHRGFGKTDLRRKANIDAVKENERFYIENTADAIIKSMQNSAKWVEIDVQMTKDKVLIIFHDFYIEDMGVNKFVPSLTYEELEQIYAKKNYIGKSKLYKILKFSDLLNLGDKNFGINVEIKYANEEDLEKENVEQTFLPIEYVKEITEAIKTSQNQKIIISSFHPQIIFALNALKFKFPLFLLVKKEAKLNYRSDLDIISETLLFIQALNLTGIVMESKMLKNREDEIIGILKYANKTIILYGEELNDFKNVTMLVKKGVNGIISDRIELFSDLVSDDNSFILND